MNKRNICTEGWTAGLGVRASWALLREGWKSKDDVIKAIKADGPNVIKGLYNVGKNTRLEIFTWLGINPNPTPPGTIQDAIRVLEANGYTVLPPNV